MSRQDHLDHNMKITTLYRHLAGALGLPRLPLRARFSSELRQTLLLFWICRFQATPSWVAQSLVGSPHKATLSGAVKGLRERGLIKLSNPWQAYDIHPGKHRWQVLSPTADGLEYAYLRCEIESLFGTCGLTDTFRNAAATQDLVMAYVLACQNRIGRIMSEHDRVSDWADSEKRPDAIVSIGRQIIAIEGEPSPKPSARIIDSTLRWLADISAGTYNHVLVGVLPKYVDRYRKAIGTGIYRFRSGKPYWTANVGAAASKRIAVIPLPNWQHLSPSGRKGGVR